MFCQFNLVLLRNHYDVWSHNGWLGIELQLKYVKQHDIIKWKSYSLLFVAAYL